MKIQDLENHYSVLKTGIPTWFPDFVFDSGLLLPFLGVSITLIIAVMMSAASVTKVMLVTAWAVFAGTLVVYVSFVLSPLNDSNIAKVENSYEKLKSYYNDDSFTNTSPSPRNLLNMMMKTRNTIREAQQLDITMKLLNDI